MQIHFNRTSFQYWIKYDLRTYCPTNINNFVPFVVSKKFKIPTAFSFLVDGCVHNFSQLLSSLASLTSLKKININYILGSASVRPQVPITVIHSRNPLLCIQIRWHVKELISIRNTDWAQMKIVEAKVRLVCILTRLDCSVTSHVIKEYLFNLINKNNHLKLKIH